MQSDFFFERENERKKETFYKTYYEERERENKTQSIKKQNKTRTIKVIKHIGKQSYRNK